VSPLVLDGPLTPGELGALCERVRSSEGASDRDPPGAVVCDVGAIVHPDVATVDALARLGLSARRAGRELRLRAPSPALCALLDLCGLAAVLRVEARRQAEEGEQPLGVEERVEMGDPPV
jgi:ABC-type transporter Mla MlaB component